MKNKPLMAVIAAGSFWGFMGLFARKLNTAGYGALVHGEETEIRKRNRPKTLGRSLGS